MSGNRRTVLRRVQWVVLAATGILGLGLVHVVTSSSASAADAVRRVTGTSARSVAAKTLTVQCPAGTTATGGFAATDAPAGVHVDRIWPRDRTVEIHATPLPTVTASWRITGGAICVADTADIQYVQSAAKTLTKALDADRRYGAATYGDCPSGKELIGFGATAVGARLTAIQPIGPGVPYTHDPSDAKYMHGVSASADAYAAGSTTATLRGIAVCANRGHGSKVQFAEVYNAKALKNATVSCPAGTQAHAVGTIIMYPNHYEEMTNFSFALIESFDSAADTTAGVWARRRPDNIPVEKWDLATYGLCA